MQLVGVRQFNCYEHELLVYHVIGDKILYLTDRQLCLIRVGKPGKLQSVKVRGSQIINLIVGKKGLVGLLFKQKILQIRRLESLGQMVCRFTDVMIKMEGNYPKMHWQGDEIYLLYADSLQIINVKDKSRRGYTDILVDYPQQTIIDLVICNLIDSEKAVILQLNNLLIFTVVPIPVTQIQIKNITRIITLAAPPHLFDSKKEYLVVLAQGLLKVFNLINLKQIAEVDLGVKEGEMIELQTDSNSECLLVRFIGKDLEFSRSIVYKVNSQGYYSQSKSYLMEDEQFFLYQISINLQENLSLLPCEVQQIDGKRLDIIQMCYLNRNGVYLIQRHVQHEYKQSLKELCCRMDASEWQENEEWREIICSYLQIRHSHIMIVPKNSIDFQLQERQMNQYRIIKEQFDQLVAKFTETMQKKKKQGILTASIDQQWNQYLTKFADERHFLQQSMKMFKIESPFLDIASIEKQHTVLQPIPQSKLDVKIDQKRKQIKQSYEKRKKLSQEEIKATQSQYEKFVAEFLAEKQKKQQELQQYKVKSQKYGTSKTDDFLTLQLPSLNQLERQIIQNKLEDSNMMQEQEKQWKKQVQKADKQIDLMSAYLRNSLSPLEEKLTVLIEKVIKIQKQGYEKVRRGECRMIKQCEVEIGQVIEQCWDKALKNIKNQIAKGIDETIQKIYSIEDKSYKQREDFITRFKQFIQFQLKHRIDLYYRSRKQLESNLNQMLDQK